MLVWLDWKGEVIQIEHIHQSDIQIHGVRVG